MPEESDKPSDECPILQAAKEGRSEILDLFSNAKPENFIKAKFNVSSKSSGETVLHLILKKKWLLALIDGVGTDDEKEDYEKR